MSMSMSDRGSPSVWTTYAESGEVEVEGEVSTYMSSKDPAKPADKRGRPEEFKLRGLCII
jgi:hypothetical protein